MIHESRKPRRPRGAFALALFSALALTAAIAAPASATSLQFKGEYPKSSYVVSDSTGTILETKESIRSCGDITGSGSYSGESSAYLQLEIAGCSSLCPGEAMVTSPLAVDFTSLPAAEGGGPIVVLDPVGTEVFAKCGSTPRLEGSLIGEIASPEEGYWSTGMTLQFEGEGGEQDHSETFRGRTTGLDLILSGNPFPVSLNFSIDLEFEEEFELSSEEDGHLDLELSGAGEGSFSGLASFFRLNSAEAEVACKDFDEEFNWPGVTSGQFLSSVQGDMSLTFTGCKMFGIFNCTTPGQKAGTIATDSLPLEPVYLSDGQPGIAISSNESTGRVLEASCFGIKFKVSGDVLAYSYSKGGWGAPNSFTAVSTVEEGAAQEYTETQDGTEFGLTLNRGGTEEPVTMGLITTAKLDSSGKGYELRE